MPVDAFVREVCLRPIALGVVVAAATVVAHRLAASWVTLAATALVPVLTYALAGYRLGIFGETEKRALRGLWQMATASR